VNRGEIWTVAGGGDYLGKPRPVVIVQDDAFEATNSVTVCGLTTDATEPVVIRVVVEPREVNGLGDRSQSMVDKITAVRRFRLDERIGHLDDTELHELDRALAVFLGIATPRATL
jgi:mRNA interferase MazF